jgi:hypothetical protein
MKLFAFGDSWTEGVGCNTHGENLYEINSIDRKLYRHTLSWPNFLSKLLNIEHQNLSAAGESNKYIFDKLIESVKSELIIEGDLVVVMWSSTLRDNVPFFPNNELHIWGKKYKEEKYKFTWVVNTIKNKITGGGYTNNSSYNLFLKNYKEFFINELYTDFYYDIINQNYIIFIQNLLEHYGIKYVFCDAFDLMLGNHINENIDKTKFINKEHYYGFREKTIKDYLISIDNTDSELWENNVKWSETPGKHPNSKGYEEISKELYKFIIDNNIITKEIPPKKQILI